MRNCEACNGSRLGSTGRPCSFCDGRGKFHPPDRDEILRLVMGRKGLRSRRPDNPRAYYVWRLARFHGGKDVTLPVLAAISVYGDPYKEELDALADEVAKAVFGTDLAGAHRWLTAMGYLDDELPGLPASAYRSGKVADETKPEEEAPELL